MGNGPKTLDCCESVFNFFTDDHIVPNEETAHQQYMKDDGHTPPHDVDSTHPNSELEAKCARKKVTRGGSSKLDLELELKDTGNLSAQDIGKMVHW
ncbi:hypothetical protein Nepgr_013619 [Nepenthes gracilis]|uniref:Uncharacterized protein n=1 Tax=Nepenthes gracilis TaxID=150966 RepID=A0AAD3SI68_NEPGR|nr:hypothetical protein Nepgr_013619 [Nepenthes gracilis]